MKSIKTNPNSAKGPDKGKIVNKLHCILLGQRQNLNSRLFKELNQPIGYTPKYTFKC